MPHAALLGLSIGMAAPARAQVQVLERARTAVARVGDASGHYSVATFRPSDLAVLIADVFSGNTLQMHDPGEFAIAAPPPSTVHWVRSLCAAPGTNGGTLQVWGNATTVLLGRDGTWNTSVAQVPALPATYPDPPHLPLGNYYFALVEDPVRRRSMLFRDGLYGFASLWEVLEFDGVQWSVAFSAKNSAPLLFPHGQYFYHPGRQRVACLPVAANSTLLEWTGTGWSAFSPPLPGSAVPTGGAAYDESRGRVVVSSTDLVALLHRTFEFDGAQWLERTTGAEPTKSRVFGPSVSLVYDPARREVLEINEDGTWAWNGTRWSPRAASVVRPPAANDAMLAEYPGRGAVLFGGRDAANVPNQETWLWKDGVWEHLTFAVRPAARSASAMTRGPGGGVILFGGVDAVGAVFSDTWYLDPATGWVAWLVGSASARQNHALATWIGAVGSERVYLFGGTNGAAWFGDLRVLDTALGKWSLLSNSGPAPRDIHAMCVDERRKRLVLFGGRDAAQNQLGDTWEFDLQGQTWTLRQPTHSPSPRVNHALVYDRTRDRVVLLGGYDGTYRSDLWEWDGEDWTQRVPSTLSIDPTENPAACFDGRIQRIVTFGGWTNGAPSDRTFEIVEWNGPGTLHDDTKLSLDLHGAPAVCGAVPSLLDLSFQNAGGASALFVGFGPTPTPSFAGAPPLFCTPQTLHTPLQVLASSATNPARFTFPVPAFLAGRLLSLQGVALNTGGCIDATEARNLLVRMLR